MKCPICDNELYTDSWEEEGRVVETLDVCNDGCKNFKVHNSYGRDEFIVGDFSAMLHLYTYSEAETLVFMAFIELAKEKARKEYQSRSKKDE